MSDTATYALLRGVQWGLVVLLVLALAAGCSPTSVCVANCFEDVDEFTGVY